MQVINKQNVYCYVITWTSMHGREDIFDSLGENKVLSNLKGEKYFVSWHFQNLFFRDGQIRRDIRHTPFHLRPTDANSLKYYYWMHGKEISTCWRDFGNWRNLEKSTHYQSQILFEVEWKNIELVTGYRRWRLPSLVFLMHLTPNLC